MTTLQNVAFHEMLFEFCSGPRLYVRSWQPGPSSRASVVIVHGIAEHGGRYTHVADVLADHGYTVSVYDLRGHGRSEGEKVYVSSFDEYLEDLARVLDRVRLSNPVESLFVFGHSMGGTIAALATIRRTCTVGGLILSAPAIGLGDDVPPWMVGVSQFLGRVVPRLPLMAVPFGGLCRDPEVVARHAADPLVYRERLGARPGAELAPRGELARAMQEVQRRMGEITLPVMILHGGDDHLVSPDGSRDLYAGVGSSDKTLKVYDGLYHEVCNEPERGRTLADMVGWLDAHLSEASLSADLQRSLPSAKSG